MTYRPPATDRRRRIPVLVRLLSALLLLAGGGALLHAGETPIRYPKSPRGDASDVHHGTKVPDPYRWLEADPRSSKKVADWLDAQGRLTSAYLASIPERKRILARLTSLWNFENYSSLSRHDGGYFYLKNDGRQDQAPLYLEDPSTGVTRILIDPNRWPGKGNVVLVHHEVSPHGKYVAYSSGRAGSDWETIRVVEVASGKVLDDELKWAKYTGISWTPDEKGFFYCRFDEPEPGATAQEAEEHHKVCYHRVGSPQDRDVLVYQRPDRPLWGFYATASEDGRFLVITAFQGVQMRVKVFLRDLRRPYAMPEFLIGDFDHADFFLGNDGPVLYFQTDRGAPRGRIVALDTRKKGEDRIRDVVPERSEILQWANRLGNLFVVRYLKDARKRVLLFTGDGAFLREVALPPVGSTRGFRGRTADTETFFRFSSLTTPPSLYRYDVITGKSALFRRANVDCDPARYETRRIFFESRDGTRIPMILAHKKGLRFDGSNPTLLYGYGGFSTSMHPDFSPSRLAWMEMGGVFAMPNIRGGGEYGRAWHEAGIKTKKQNVFDDFIAAAEWLIESKITRPDKLAIQGSSNGGLLVGAVMTQRPELFGACLPDASVLDMIRYARFTCGRLWAVEYGSVENAEEFRALLAYSPYHNLKKGTRYPPTLITTSDSDERVAPLHSYKFAAALQHAQGGPGPLLLRVERHGGHSSATSAGKTMEELADQFAFLVKNLSMKLPEEK
ncbi:MAG: prolyl oligopeptidase family serine peptidase [Planctomycetota bacterium]